MIEKDEDEMKKRVVMAALALSTLCAACSTSEKEAQKVTTTSVKESIAESVSLNETKYAEEWSLTEDASRQTEEFLTEESSPLKENADHVYYEIQLEADLLDKEAVAEAIFGNRTYEKEQVDTSWNYFLDDQTGIDFWTDTYFQYYKDPYQLWYTSTIMCPWGAVALQDMRLEALLPESELPNGGKEEAEQVCDRVIEAMGYDYTEKRIFAIDPEWGNLKQIPSPAQPADGEKVLDSYQNLIPWEADEGAYLVIYRNGNLVDVEEEVSFVDLNCVCEMIYSPKYGLCYMMMEPVFHEVSRQEVEVITEAEAREQVENLFHVNQFSYDLVEITGCELVYCRNPYSEDDDHDTSSVLPCWKVSFRPKESDEAIWEQEGSVVRGTSVSEGYLILDARVGGSVDTFNLNVRF